MFDHFEIKVLKFDECVRFYSIVLQPLYIELKWSDDSAAGFGSAAEDKTRFLIEKQTGSSVCNVHIALKAASEAVVNKFYIAGVEQGYVCNGKPGLRDNYAPNYYAAFLLDPDGNNIEAVVYL